ncbi:hypothetical protein CORC01_07304 [Colletotrichum orchidophilum]|uniref:Uncharacterized protein n=1 Tax=Colletotrichum orchidophilum TaxID=1209926 RepID=A0A1G4B7H6_9PEZI|nr:uncharacterized protein CORC01_07304 [Colletotrichum orchidophilum]OHE97399.1 hypothetical protein CORC01_07304 [Colletotrichum orchidophilum]
MTQDGLAYGAPDGAALRPVMLNIAGLIAVAAPSPSETIPVDGMRQLSGISQGSHTTLTQLQIFRKSEDWVMPAHGGYQIPGCLD